MEKCREIECIPDAWQTVESIPLRKKGDKRYQGSYRTVPVMSHAGKMVEAAIGRVIREVYQFRNCQLEFQEKTSSEVAISRHITSARYTRYTTVLVLKVAYNCVPRDKIIDEVR